MLVSINLLTYNAERFIKSCLESVLAQTYLPVELLIIDNNSSDGTVGIAQKIIEQASSKFPVRVICNEKNLGFAGGHNLGIEESKGDLILCLNQDVILAPNFIEKAVKFFENNKDTKVGVLQPKLLRLSSESCPSDIIDTAGLVMLKNRRIISRGQGEKDIGQYDAPDEIFGADGAAPVYRREALEDVKLATCDLRLATTNGEYFDEAFFAYKEDVDITWRMRLYGWRAFYLPQMIGWHARGAGDSAATNYFDIIRERLKISKFAKYVAFKNQRLMQIKNEQGWLLFKHSPWFLPKEIASWIYVLLFERFTWKAIKDLFLQAPDAWKKRKIIMSRKSVGAREMEKWFR